MKADVYFSGRLTCEVFQPKKLSKIEKLLAQTPIELVEPIANFWLCNTKMITRAESAYCSIGSKNIPI